MIVRIKNIFLIAALPFLVGCLAERNLLRSVNDSENSVQYFDQVEKAQDKISLYIGKGSDVLLKDFGPPTEINKNVLHKGKTYDEEWYYYHSTGLPLVNQNSWAYIFYINNHIIESAVFL